MEFLDVGGGFQDCNFESMAEALTQAIVSAFPEGVSVIAEPGRYFARSAYTLACKVIARRKHVGGMSPNPPDMLYQNDGIYGNFMNVLIEKEIITPSLIPPKSSLSQQDKGQRKKHIYSLWGPTCDSVDCINRKVVLEREVDVGDWLKYSNMGGEKL